MPPNLLSTPPFQVCQVSPPQYLLHTALDFPRHGCVCLTLICPSSVSSDTVSSRKLLRIPQGRREEVKCSSYVFSEQPDFTSSPALLILYCNYTFIFVTPLITCEQTEDRNYVFYLVYIRCLAYVCWANKWHMNTCASLLELGHQM